MKTQKKLTAKELLEYLKLIEKSGHDLSKITINFRRDMDSDVFCASNVGEDLFDGETNSRIESIVFVEDEN